MTPKATIIKPKYGNNYPDSFMPTYTWDGAKQKDREREEELAKKVKGNIEFRVMTGWHRFFALSVEMYRNKRVPRFVKWILYVLAFLGLVWLAYYMRY